MVALGNQPYSAPPGRSVARRATTGLFVVPSPRVQDLLYRRYARPTSRKFPSPDVPAPIQQKGQRYSLAPLVLFAPRR